MRRRTANNERPLAPTAPRRRPGQTEADNQTAASPAELNPASSLSKVLRQRELASASRSRTARAKAAAAANAAATPANPSGSGSASSSSRRVRPVAAQVIRTPARASAPGRSLQPSASSGLSRSSGGSGLHPLSDGRANATLRAYEERTLGAFDRIVPVLKRLSALQHEPDFVAQA